jgi:hypothetical protein
MPIAALRVPAPTYFHPIEATVIERLNDEGESLVERYLNENQNEGVPFIGRDAAKLLFSEYLNDRTQNNRYIDAAASAIADAARRTLLLRSPQPPRNRVLILTGCPASGKTGAAGPRVADKIEFVHETILTAFPRAVELIDQLLQSGRIPILRLFYTDDPRINVRRMIERARRIGRTIPVTYMAATYIEVPALVARLQLKFGMHVQLTNNSRSPAEAIHHTGIARALLDVGRYNKESALEAMLGELDAICAGPNKIPAAILREARRT